MKNSDTSLQERLRNDDKNALGEIYLEHKEAFLAYASRYEIDRDALLDIYQDSTVALYQNFVEKQLTLTTSTVKTYLFGIAKYQIFNALKAKKKLFALTKEPEAIETVVIEEETITQEQRLLGKYFSKIGTSCQEILKMYYYRGLTIKEMVQYSHYKDENTVKSHKSRCLKKLKNMIALN